MSKPVPTIEYDRRPEDGILALQVEYFFKMIPHLDPKFTYRNEQVVMAKDFANLLESQSRFMYNRITYLKRFSDFKLNQHLDQIIIQFLDFYIQYVQAELLQAQQAPAAGASHTPELGSGVEQAWLTSAQLAGNPQYTQQISHLESYTSSLRQAQLQGELSSAQQQQQAQAFKAQIVRLLPNAPRDLGLVSPNAGAQPPLPHDPHFLAQLITTSNKTHQRARTGKWYLDANKFASNATQSLSFDPLKSSGETSASSSRAEADLEASEDVSLVTPTRRRTRSALELVGNATPTGTAKRKTKEKTTQPTQAPLETIFSLDPEGNLNNATFKILAPVSSSPAQHPQGAAWEEAYQEGREQQLSYAQILRLFLQRLQPRDYVSYASLIQGSLRSQELLTLHLTRYLIEEGCFGKEWQQDFLAHFTSADIELDEESESNADDSDSGASSTSATSSERVPSLNDALNDTQLRLAMISHETTGVAEEEGNLHAQTGANSADANPPSQYSWIGKSEVATLSREATPRNEQTELLATLTSELFSFDSETANTTPNTAPSIPVANLGTPDELAPAHKEQGQDRATQNRTASESLGASTDAVGTHPQDETLNDLRRAQQTSVLAQMRWLQGCLVVDQFLAQNPQHLEQFHENFTRFKMAFKDLLTMVREAPTGTGKSLAYLVPIILGHKRALVSTHVKSLQDQLLEDLPYLGAQLVRVQAANRDRDNFPISFKSDDSIEFGKFSFKAFNYRPLKGQTNYICPRFIAFLGLAFQQTRHKHSYLNSFMQELGGQEGAAKGERSITTAAEKFPLDQIISSFIPQHEIKRVSEDLSSEEFAELEQRYSLKKAPHGLEVLRKHEQTEQSLCVISHAQYQKIQEFCRSTPVRDWETDQLREIENLTSDLRTTLTLNHEDCRGMKVCGFGKVCPFRNARLELQDADIGILNHSLLISASLNQLEYTQDRDVFVCDEAHNMVSVLKDTGHIAVNQQQVSKLFTEINTQLHFDPLDFDELFGTQLERQAQLQAELLEHLGYAELRESLRRQAQRKVEIPERDYLPIDYNFVASVPQAFIWQSNTVNVSANRTLAQLVDKILSDPSNFTHRTYDFFNVFNPLTVLEYDLIRHPVYLFYSYANEVEIPATQLPLPLHLEQQLRNFTYDAQRKQLVPREAQATRSSCVPNYELWQIAYQLEQLVRSSTNLRLRVRSDLQELNRISALRLDFNTPDPDIELRLSYARRLLPLKEENRALKDYLHTSQKHSYRATYIDSKDFNHFDKLPEHEILQELLGIKSTPLNLVSNQVTIQRQLQGLLPLNLRLEDNLLRLWQISFNTGRDARSLYANSLAQNIRNAYQHSGITAMLFNDHDPLGLAQLAQADTAEQNPAQASAPSKRQRKNKDGATLANLVAQNYVSLGKERSAQETPSSPAHEQATTSSAAPHDLLGQLEHLRAQQGQRGLQDSQTAEAQWFASNSEQALGSPARETPTSASSELDQQIQALTPQSPKNGKKATSSGESAEDQYCKVASYVRQASWTSVYDQLDRWWIKQEASYRSFIPEYLQFKARVPDRLKLAHRDSERALAATSLNRNTATTLLGASKYQQLLRSYFLPQHHAKLAGTRFALLEPHLRSQLAGKLSKLNLTAPKKEDAQGVDSLEDTVEFSNQLAQGAYLRWVDTQLLHAMFARHECELTGYLNDKFWWQQEQAHLLRYSVAQQAHAYLEYYQPRYLELHNSTFHLDNIPAILRSQLQHLQHRVQLCQEFAQTRFGIFHESEYRNLETLIAIEGQRRSQLVLRNMAEFANLFTRLSNNILAYGQTQFQQAKYLERNFTEANYTTKEIKWDDLSLYNTRGQRNKNIVARHTYFSAPHIDLQGQITLPTIHGPLDLQSEQDKLNHTQQVLEQIHQLVDTLAGLWRNLDSYIGSYLLARQQQARDVYAAISEQFSRLKAQQERSSGTRHVVGYSSEEEDEVHASEATADGASSKGASDALARRHKLPTLTQVYNCTNEHELRAMQVSASMMVNKSEELHNEWSNLGELLKFMVAFRGEPKDAQSERYCYIRVDTHPFTPEVTFNVANLTACLPFQRIRNHLPANLRWLFTSATLYTDKHNNYLSNNLGLTRFANSAQVASPFKSDDMAMLYFSTHESQHANHAHLNDDALELILANEGKCLWLCTSRKRVEQLQEVLQAALNERVRKDAIKYFNQPSSELEFDSHDAYIKEHRYTVIAQVNDANKQELVEMLRHNSRTILIATRSFWEGVNVVGDNLSLLILDKFPYPQLNAYYRVLQQTLNNHVYNNDYYVADGFIQFKQGVGRLIRNEDDFGVVAILESRISSSGRGLGPMVYQKILSNYPTYRIAPDLKSAQKFLQRKREQFYELQASKKSSHKQDSAMASLMHTAQSVYLRQPQLNYDNMRLNYDANNSLPGDLILSNAMQTFLRFELQNLNFKPLASNSSPLTDKGMATMDQLMGEVEHNLQATRAVQQEADNLSIDLFASTQS